MKLKICLMGLLCLYFKAHAQDYNSIQPLKIGDAVPDITLSELVNYKSDKIKLSAFGNKLIILDFWSTTCGSCIAMMPEDVALQLKFKDSLQFLLVDAKNTKDTKEKVNRFFNTYHTSYKILPSVVSDTVLSKLFPHLTVGYYVWIRNNKVLAMTDDQDLTIKNISTVLTGSTPSIKQKTFIAYDVRQPLFLNGNGGDAPGYTYRSILTPYKDGLHGYYAATMDGEDLCTGYKFVNTVRMTLYRVMYPSLSEYSENRIIYNVKHPDDFSADSVSQRWRNRNLFIYESMFPPTSKIKAMAIVRADLDRFFHLHFDSVFRDTSCFIVESVKDFQKGTSKLADQSTQNNNDLMRDFPINDVIYGLNDRSKVPFIDETGSNATISMPFEHDDFTIDQIIALLKEHGFSVKRANRKLKFLVVSDIDSQD